MRRQIQRSRGLRASLALAMLVAPGVARAQQPTPVKAPSVLSGRVLDEGTDAPIRGVLVGVAGARAEARTDDGGYFAFTLTEAGTQRLVLTFSRIGYVKGTQMVDLVAGDTTRASFFLARSATTLDTVTVTADAMTTSARLSGFERRRRLNIGGTFITQAEIERRHPVATFDLFRGLVGVRVMDSIDAQLTIRMLVSSRGDRMAWNRAKNAVDWVPCYLQIGVDGQVMPPGFSVDEIVPKDIYGIEVYSGPSTMPRELMAMDQEGFCGLVMIWTRSDRAP